jgi:protocatechuate 3,4-dioxygenase beta subunit
VKRYVLSALLFLVGLQISASIGVAQGLGVPQVPVAKATIEGTVVHSSTGDPVRRAQITIVRNAPAPVAAGQPNPAATQPQAGQRGAAPQGAQGQQNAATAQTPSIAPVFTDDQGRFQLTDLEPGTYRLFAARNGYTRMEYGQKLMNRPGTALNITAGQIMKDVAFKLTPAGTVTGRIVDELGEPLPGLTVQILRSTYDQNGKRTLQPTSTAKSNDLGEYRVYFVPPGRYFVSALAAAPSFDALLAAAANPGGGANTNEVVAPGYVQTYFPNTTDYTRASAIDVLPGSEVSAMNFTMVRQQRFHIKGHVIDVTTGMPPQVAQLSLSPRNSAVAQNPLDAILGAAAGTGANYNSADGTFDLRDVAPGSYWLQTMAVPTPPAGAAQGAAGAAAAVLASMMTAIQPVEVSGADADNLTIAVGGGITIPGRIQVEGTAPPAFGFDRIALSLNPTSGVVTLGSVLQIARPASDGAFSLEKVNAGEYRFAIQGLPPAMYVKSARFDQNDILASGFTVTDRSPGTLQVVVSANSGQISGNVVDKDTKPVRGIPTVLIPDRNRDRRELFKFAQTDQNGHFIMNGISPGDYKLFAWEDIEPFSYFDTDVLKQFEDNGKPVHVVETTKESYDIKLIPAATP